MKKPAKFGIAGLSALVLVLILLLRTCRWNSGHGGGGGGGSVPSPPAPAAVAGVTLDTTDAADGGRTAVYAVTEKAITGIQSITPVSAVSAPIKPDYSGSLSGVAALDLAGLPVTANAGDGVSGGSTGPVTAAPGRAGDALIQRERLYAGGLYLSGAGSGGAIIIDDRVFAFGGFRLGAGWEFGSGLGLGVETGLSGASEGLIVPLALTASWRFALSGTFALRPVLALGGAMVIRHGSAPDPYIAPRLDFEIEAKRYHLALIFGAGAELYPEPLGLVPAPVAAIGIIYRTDSK